MKSKIYIIAIMATLFVASAKSQEMLVNGSFPTFSHTSFSTYWPDGWTFAGSDPFTSAAGVATMTANSSKKVEFEDYNDLLPSLREVYQIVKLGIGTFHVSDTVKVNDWDAVSPYNIVITDPQGVELLRMNHANNGNAYVGYVSPDFVTTKDAPYKFSIQCTKDGSDGWSNAYIWFVSLMQTDGNAYDPEADTTPTAVKELVKNTCNAVIIDNKIVMTSQDPILKASLISSNGSIIYDEIVNKNRLEIAEPSQRGIYIVKMQTANQNKVIKIMRQ